MQDYQQLAADTQRELGQKNVEHSRKVIADVRAVIRDIAQQEKLLLVLEENDQPVLYAEDGPDLTDRVIKAYDASSRNMPAPGGVSSFGDGGRATWVTSFIPGGRPCRKRIRLGHWALVPVVAHCSIAPVVPARSVSVRARPGSRIRYSLRLDFSARAARWTTVTS